MSTVENGAGLVRVWLLDPSEPPLGEFSTVNISEWPNDASVLSLSQILLAVVHPKYFLSPTACRGVIRRAEKREKKLPAHLQKALETVALMTDEQLNTLLAHLRPGPEEEVTAPKKLPRANTSPKKSRDLSPAKTATTKARKAPKTGTTSSHLRSRRNGRKDGADRPGTNAKTS